MNGVALTLRALHHGEEHLADQLTRVAERHRTEHEIHHVATDLAQWSREHAQRLADTARDRDVDPHPGLLGDSAGAQVADVLSTLGEKAAQLMGRQVTGRRPEPGLLLLRDLRDLHLAATENSLLWEMLAQVAQATKDESLLTLASECHPHTLRQMRWTNSMIKTLSPQILSSL
ncbi:hypothetical protein ACKI1I_27840 [Streptomyces turgidiscabies]|uniref:Uncharacterized protein n=1 Tax=Streptomyces turgidiscabies (strain Car8) TaxID=698760 RepID=L7F4Q4_STRT8|nr:MULTISPECIES: hypothetical protein [Streptomyces]ELP65590.1 hypothetical protein STRTUCAR8_07193 [Streptomyces turgidiscabies Car8]MDX3495300.1 hypothetical protein [Streptomyces turgidiscabies]GAQ69987.1 hypothetical protein T45_01719 [Streptomyces turgidiscabies]